MLKIAQLSDCHVGADPETLYRGQDAAANLARTWKRTLAWSPDLVLLTGDVSEDASRASYERVCGILDFDKEILSLPGNHDDPSVMREYFPLGPWNGPLLHECGDWLIVMLDSSAPHKIDGHFSEKRLAALRESLAQSSKPNILVALHHQPVPVGAPWIDRYALTRPGDFLKIVDADARVRCVVWGHIHHHFARSRHGVLYLGAPSTAVNSLTGTERFDPDPSGPAFRTLELQDSGSINYGQIFA